MALGYSVERERLGDQGREPACIQVASRAHAGGIGGVGGTAIGVAFLATLQQGLSISGVQDYWQQIITGVILIVVVLLDRIQHGGLASVGLGRVSRHGGSGR